MNIISQSTTETQESDVLTISAGDVRIWQIRNDMRLMDDCEAIEQSGSGKRGEKQWIDYMF